MSFDIEEMNCHTEAALDNQQPQEPSIETQENNSSFNIEKELKTEVTKSTVSQAFGTAIFPIGRELGNLTELGIQKIKKTIGEWRKEKYLSVNEKEISEIKKKIENNPSRIKDIEKLHIAFESASEKEIEDDNVMFLWQSIIERINSGDQDTELLIEKLNLLTTSEAHFLINFEKNKYTTINKIVSSLRMFNDDSDEKRRKRQIAQSLESKGILEQGFPVLNTVLGFLIIVGAFLIGAEAFRAFWEAKNINISSANNVILLGIIGVFFSFIFISQIKVQCKLTWIGKKLFDGAEKASSKSKST